MEELHAIPGTGQNGRVTKTDIMRYIKQQATGSPSPPIPKKPGEDRMIPMDNVRKKTAQHMRESLDTSAHVYFVSECDFTDILAFIRERGESFSQSEGFKLTITPFVVNAAIKALSEYPRVNSSITGDTIIEKRHINVGLAVSTPHGLLVPVIQNAEERNFKGLARAANELANRARTKRLGISDIEGSTFTISNFGMFGNTIGFPIINQPNVAILGVGAIKKRPIVRETPEGEAIIIRSMGNLALSFDHRIIDGELGGRFLQSIATNIERFNLSDTLETGRS